MRSILLASSFVLVSAVAGCNARESAPAPSPTSAPTSASLPPISKAAPLNPQEAPLPLPATVVFAGAEGGIRGVGAVVEDASAAPISLSVAAVDTVYVRPIPGRRVLLAEHAHDKSIRALVAASVANGERATLGTLPQGKYAEVVELKETGGTLVVELKRVGAVSLTNGNDVVALHAGTEPVLLASGARLAAAAAGRAAVLSGGNLHSVKLDGSDKVALGGGDGHDKVAEARGDKLLLTLHAGTSGDVRLTGIDGTGVVDVGKADVDESAFGLTAQRLVFVRRVGVPDARAVLVSTALDGKDEQTLSDPDLDARPIQITEGGQILFGSATGAFLIVGALGIAGGSGAPRVLDPAAGSNVRIGAVHSGQVVYRSDAPHWPALRVAKLDGSGVVSLIEAPPALPFFGGISPDGRVVYYRTLSGQLEGGRVFSVKLDGTDQRAVGVAVAGTDGKMLAGGPSDQDFESLTPAGRVILESEFDVNGGGSQLLVGSAESDTARLLSGASHVRFAALIP